MAPAPTPQERFELAKQSAALLRALLSHPGMSFNGDGSPNRAGIHPTLYNVTDFHMSTYTKYILPLLPPNAAENCSALSFQPNAQITDKTDLLADDLYPRIKSGALREKWSDTLSRNVMIASIILDKNQQVLFGGTFDFGPEVQAAARALRS
ncbi:hypothetical protein A1O3_00859 [Capronia epimyces CBS 606.96]|uniref:Uncharacterized protein n=1 Tax=Capronia epimyces CBS 606.96 TaxID=1182542 RepID=W9ZCQ5_9EURO|nr:uncharacterized protein A1O3_00859 [Capronia epimyces CBS 606.96]EXJ92309.1 hypothetical protein A1O3_00859 [Capronia epimyces CBS 606.96]